MKRWKFRRKIHPVISIMTSGSAQLPYQGWGSNLARPIVFRHGWPLEFGKRVSAGLPCTVRKPFLTLRANLVIIGAGFAGMYAALSAARLRDIQGVSPEDSSRAGCARTDAGGSAAALRAQAGNLDRAAAWMCSMRSTSPMCRAAPKRSTPRRARWGSTAKGPRQTLSYDRLVVATGSRLFRPDIPGLAEHGFSVDQLDDAIALDKHLHGLADRPAMNGRDTVVVAGGGFTGIEAATEMLSGFARSSARMPSRASSSSNATPRSRPTWAKAPPGHRGCARKLGVETRLGAGVASLDESGVTLSNGEHIETETVIWAAGIRAAPLTAQIPPSATISAGCWSTAICACPACRASSPPAMPPAPPATMPATTR